MKKEMIITLLFVSITVFAQEKELNVAVEIAYVISDGYWEEGENSGLYRVVVIRSGWEHIHCAVYLQWISEPHEQKQEQAILYSTPIAEINDSKMWSVGIPEFQYPPLLIRLEATNSYTLENKVFSIKPKADGKYEFGYLLK